MWKRERGGGALSGLYLSFLWESFVLFLVFSMVFSSMMSIFARLLLWWKRWSIYLRGKINNQQGSTTLTLPGPALRVTRLHRRKGELQGWI